MLVANLFENVRNYSNHLLIIVKDGFRMNKAVRSLKFITLKEKASFSFSSLSTSLVLLLLLSITYRFSQA